MSVLSYMAILSVDVEIFHLKLQIAWWRYRKSQGISKVFRIHPLVTLNLCAKFHS